MTRTRRTSAVALAAFTCAAAITLPPAAVPAGAAAPGAAPSTSAAQGRGIDAIKQAVTARIDKRLAALQRFGTTLAEAKQVQPAHRTTLTKLLDDQTAGLTALRAKVQAETAREALKADARAMVTDYRVFALTGPKIRLTAAIDTELAVVEKLRDTKDVTAIAASLDGKVDALLAIKPGPDGPAIRAAVQPIREAAKKARTDLKALRD